VVLDVRTPREWRERHIAGSVHIPLNHLRERLHEVPRHQRLVVHCQSGYRSAIAAGLLEQYGVTQLADLVGGFAAWEAAQPDMLCTAH
jgi:rhodanese-related sulfurtransferase